MALNYRNARFPSCCGLDIVHNLNTTGSSTTARLDGGVAKVAVTNAGQERAGVTAQLERDGFQRVATFVGNYNNPLQLWLRPRGWMSPRPVRTPRVPDSGEMYISRQTGRPVTTAWALRNPRKVRRVTVPADAPSL
jgi:hypothetical protein